jgi:hypothetical protein
MGMNNKPWKSHYRICNWRQDNAALVSRDSLTFWFDESAIKNWKVHE